MLKLLKLTYHVLGDCSRHTEPIQLILANFQVCFSFGSHYNALFVQITISNTRSKRVNENITRRTSAHARKKNVYMYMQIFMFVGFVVIEIRLFNRKKKQKKQKQKKKMKNSENLNYMYYTCFPIFSDFFQISLAFNMFPTLVLV